METMLPSRLGKLRIVCSLPLFSDAITIKGQSAAEHAYTQVLLAIALSPQLGLTTDQECDLLELCIFAEMPKSYLGDPSFYLRQRHPEAQEMYKKVRGRLWLETEETLNYKTTRAPELFGLHVLLDAFSARLFIEKECLLGNSYMIPERHKTHYHNMRRLALSGVDLSKEHPCTFIEGSPRYCSVKKIDWAGAVNTLDNLFDEATRARQEGGIGEYSATFLGMMEKLKEHYRYKGWSYHFPESVGEHTFQVVYLARILADELKLNSRQRIDLYKMTCLHDLAEAYASDVVYPVKMREKDLGDMHQKLENAIIEDVCKRLNIDLTHEKDLDPLVDICDRFSAKLYFDREIRSGNNHFRVPNTSMEHTRTKYEAKFPQVFKLLDELWDEYLKCMPT